MRKSTVFWLLGVMLVLLIATMGASFYMLSYSLAPDPNRADRDSCFNQLFTKYPETQAWVDSLKQADALRDTFITMRNGERHHALYVRNGSHRTALLLHGWRGCSIRFLYLARLYEQALGFNVLLPDMHAHGLSEGDMIQMGWIDRKDALQWLAAFRTDTMVVHGVSMGGATAMMMSAEELPEGIRCIHFVDDCGYTSVWDEFAGELKNQFGLPEFPLMYTTSLLCKLRNGWSFGEASALHEVKKSTRPILFIHGADDTFVPTEMVRRLYAAKPSNKELWIAEGAEHGESYLKHPDEYRERIRAFLLKY